jgi:hypothetical protein
MYSDATFLASRAAIVAGASFMRLRFRVRAPLTKSSCQQSNHQKAPSLNGFGFWYLRRAIFSKSSGGFGAAESVLSTKVSDA